MDNNLVPRLRTDLFFDILNENGQEFVAISDPLMIVNEPVALSLPFFFLLQSLDEKMTWQELDELLQSQSSNKEDSEIVINMIHFLADSGVLEAEYYFKEKESLHSGYLKLVDRPCVCAGNSYPENIEELELFLNNFLKIDNSKINKNAKAIIAPHIDFRIEEASEVYSAAYSAIAESDADLFVVLGTSHQLSSDYFMLSNKNYSTPLGVVETDKQVLEILKNSAVEMNFDELAHRFEHSIEFQVLLLQHLFKNKKFTILPVLVGSLHEFLFENRSPEANTRFLELLNTLKDAINSSGKKAVFISSVDFAHIGKKFGDDFPASEQLEYLKSEDMKLINYLKSVNSEEFFKKNAEDKDKWRICGLSPIYSMLKILDAQKGEFLSYAQWNEKETESAVTFAAMSFE